MLWWIGVRQLIPFVIISPPSSQGQDHLHHQRQVEDGKKPVESIVLHPHHSPHPYERDEDKERPGHHGTNELEEHDASLWVCEAHWRSSGSHGCCRVQRSSTVCERSERVQCYRRGGKGARARLQEPAVFFRLLQCTSNLDDMSVVCRDMQLLTLNHCDMYSDNPKVINMLAHSKHACKIHFNQ